MKPAVASLIVLLVAALARAAAPPAPYGPVPSPRQLQWQQMELIGFLHFTVNTFTDKEWGDGDEPEKVFNPTDFDAEQIVGTLAGGGHEGGDPHLQTPRRLLPLAEPVHRALGQEQPVERAARATWCGRFPPPAAATG